MTKTSTLEGGWNGPRVKVIAPHDQCLRWVKTGKTHHEHMFSALPLRADIAQRSLHVRFVAMNRRRGASAIPTAGLCGDVTALQVVVISL